MKYYKALWIEIIKPSKEYWLTKYFFDHFFLIYENFQLFDKKKVFCGLVIKIKWFMQIISYHSI